MAEAQFTKSRIQGTKGEWRPHSEAKTSLLGWGGALLESLCKEDLVGVGWGLGSGCPQALEQNHKASLGSGFVFIGVCVCLSVCVCV